MDGSSGGFTFVLDASTAEGAIFISNPGAVSGANAGYTWVALYSPGNIHNSTFIANAATVSGAEGGWAEIDGGTSEGANFTANGATTHWIVGYEVRNVGRTACLASGTARLDLFDAQGRPLFVNQSSKAMMMRGRMPAGRIRLAPGTRGFVGVAGSHCDRNQPTAQTAQFTMPGEVRPTVAPTELELCPDGTVAVSPVRSDAQDIYE